MSQIPSTGTFPPANQLSGGASQGIQDLDLNKFIDLMIAELQNQDPLNPLDNNEMLQQITQIREIGATGRLTETLESVLLGQNLTSATSMIGKTVKAMSDDAMEVSGLVDRVTVTDGEPRLHIGDKAIGLKNVKEVLSSVDADNVAAQAGGQLGGGQ